MSARQSVLREERGSALILAVIAMVVMGVLSVSFALLANIETRIGVDYKQQAQAEALAEAALERARDFVRTAPTTTGGFTSWINGTAVGMGGPHLFGWNGATLGAGRYWARIDNDCTAANPGPPAWFPGSIQEPPIGVTPCDNTTDTNETAVLTAWAQTNGSARSRIRVIVAVDSPWKHVCSNARMDSNGYCNEPGTRNGNPTINPSDPNDPHGPAAYDDLPRPVLGCSRVAPGLHRATSALLAQVNGCAMWSGMYTYPYPVAPLTPPRFVVMGEIPGTLPRAKSCNNDAGIGGSGNVYFGHFDCALTTWCDPAVAGHVWCGPDAGPGGKRWACVPGTDSRVASDPAHYVPYNPATGLCGSGQRHETGMVFNAQGGTAGAIHFSATMGSATRQFDVYIHNAAWRQADNGQLYGTLVLEGNGGGGIQFAVGSGTSTQLWAGKNGLPPTAAWPAPMTYGYPLAALVYDPDLGPPTALSHSPQNHLADFGDANSQIHGIIYSAGHVQFNRLSLDGGMVAYEIQTRGNGDYTYNPAYGNATPPAGFLDGSGNQVVSVRKSFTVCVNYSADTGARPTGCN